MVRLDHDHFFLTRLIDEDNVDLRITRERMVMHLANTSEWLLMINRKRRVPASKRSTCLPTKGG